MKRLLFLVVILTGCGLLKDPVIHGKRDYVKAKPQEGLLQAKAVTCLRDDLLIGADTGGEWTVILQQDGAGLADTLVSDNPCLDFSLLPTGLYSFQYQICKTNFYGFERCAAICVNYYHIDVGTIANGTRSLCAATDTTFIIVDEFGIVIGEDAEYLFEGDLPEFDQYGIYSRYHPQFSVLPTPDTIKITRTPFAPLGYALDPNCLPETFEFIIESCECITPNITGTDTVCVGDPIVLNVTPTGKTYAWSNGDNTSTMNDVATTSQDYYVTITDDLGCEVLDTFSVYVPSGAANAGLDKTVCPGGTTTIDGSGGVLYAWSPATYLSATNIDTPSVINPLATTLYTLTVTDAFGCTSTDQVLVTLGTDPVANAGVDTSLCVGETINLIASATGGGGGYTYSWDNGLGAGATQSISPIVTTTYIVTVTDANGCTDTDDVLVTVNGLPTIVASADVDICIGENTTISATGGVTYSWSPTTGLSDPNISNPVATPTTTTTYTVTGTNASGCVSTDDVIVTVNPLPTANAGADVAITCGDSTTLGASGGVTYAWSPITDLSDPNIANPEAFPQTTTTYTVTVTDANGCTDTDEVEVSVTGTCCTVSIFGITGTNTICSGQSTSFTVSLNPGATPTISYSWSGPSGYTSTSATATGITTAGTYNVTVSSTAGCQDVGSRILTVNPLPTVTASTTNANTCEGQTTTLNASGAVSYVWNNGAGTGSSVNVSPSTTTTYTVTGTDANGCTDTDQVTITVTPYPNASISGTNVICSGQTATFTASAGDSWSWTGPGGYTASTQVISGLTVAGTYTVTISDNGCSDAGSISNRTLTVNPAPSVAITAGTNPVCEGTGVSLNAVGSGGSGGGYTYAWNQGLGSGAAQTATGVSEDGVKNYIVTVTDGNGCTATDNVNIFWYDTPTANAGADATICEGSNTTLNGTGAGTPVWTPSTGLSDPNILNPVASPTVTTVYTLTMSNGTCPDATDQVTVNVNPAPNPSLTTTPTCDGDNIGYTWTSTGASTYDWVIFRPVGGAAGTTAGTSASTTSNGSGNYSITVTDNDTGCTATRTDNVTVQTESAEVDLTSVSVVGCLLIWDLQINCNCGTCAGGIQITREVRRNGVPLGGNPFNQNVTCGQTILGNNTAVSVANVGDVFDFIYSQGPSSGCTVNSTSFSYTITAADVAGCP